MKRPLAVLMLDIEHFKQFNDTWGHDGGDGVLREIAVLVQALFRGDDSPAGTAARSSCWCSPKPRWPDAHARAEQLRQAVEGLVLNHRDQPLGSITVSIGVAALPEQGTSPDQLIAAADRALYRAKSAGRNRTVAASPPRRAIAAAIGAA